jgi:hypothetical protein
MFFRRCAHGIVQDGKEQCILSGLKPILLFVILLCLALAGCSGDSPPGKPDLPPSVSPGWAMKSYEGSPPPEGLPDGAKPVCWKAQYAGSGGASAEVWVCGYAHGAFDAGQRTRAAANTLKFDRGNYLVVVRWNGGTRTDVVALMRGLEGALK